MRRRLNEPEVLRRCVIRLSHQDVLLSTLPSLLLLLLFTSPLPVSPSAAESSSQSAAHSYDHGGEGKRKGSLGVWEGAAMAHEASANTVHRKMISSKLPILRRTLLQGGGGGRMQAGQQKDDLGGFTVGRVEEMEDELDDQISTIDPKLRVGLMAVLQRVRVEKERMTKEVEMLQAQVEATERASATSSDAATKAVDASAARAMSVVDRVRKMKAKMQEGKCMTKGGKGRKEGGEGQGEEGLFSVHAMEGAFSEGFISWLPTPGFGLILDCRHSHTSDRIRCIRNHALVAGLLNRTLIVPRLSEDAAEAILHQGKADVGVREVGAIEQHQEPLLAPIFDIAHLQKCFGAASAMGSSEFRSAFQAGGGRIEVERILCWDERCYDLGSLGGTEKPPESPDLKYPEGMRTGSMNLRTGKGARLAEFEAKATEGKAARVLLLGDLRDFPEFDGAEDKELYRHGDLPFFRLPDCPNAAAVQPPLPVFEAAENFISANFGAQLFMAVFWKGGRMQAGEAECSSAHPCVANLVDAAACVLSSARKHGLSHIFLAGSEDELEIEEMRKVLLEAGSDIVKSVVLFPRAFESQPWASIALPPPQQQQQQQREMTVALPWPLPKSQLRLLQIALQNVICAKSSVFLGAFSSPFSAEIERLRVGIHTAVCEDAFICGP